VSWDTYPSANTEVSVGPSKTNDNQDADSDVGSISSDEDHSAEEEGDVDPSAPSGDLRGSVRRELVKQAQAGKFDNNEEEADKSLGDGAESSTDEEDGDEEEEEEAEEIGAESRRHGPIPHYGQPFFGRGFVPHTIRFG
jgi:hypothetical protein